MRLDQTASIRFNIMLIAFLGGAGFLCYLLVNIHLANENKDRLQELLDHRYPVIEQIRLLKQEADGIRENLTAAVALEDGFLVEDSIDLANQFRDNVRRLEQMEPGLHSNLKELMQSFDHYYDQARLVALWLIENQGDLRQQRGRLDDTHRAFSLVMASVDAMYASAQAEYAALLLKTHTAVIDANRLGAVLGALIIVGLVILAWAISGRVQTAINRSDQVKEAFLATISHELRTPMNGIIGALHLMRGRSLQSEQETLVKAAMDSAAAMMVSIDDILVFSEIMSGQGSVNATETCLGAELERMLSGIRNIASQRGLTFEYRIAPELAQVVRADVARVLHVVRHLAGNGLKFTEQGGVQIDIVWTPDPLRQQAQVQVQVVDSGPGIDPAKLGTLFRPFEQLDSSFSRRHQGMGMGLAICAAIARLLGGRVRVENHEPHGVVAQFVFPVQLIARDEVRDSAPKRPLATVSASPRIMVVEDNPVNQMVIKGYLKKLGCVVLTASNGKEALEALQRESVDLILMDCQMPVMDGLEATRHIRRLPVPVGQVPIVAVTANVMDADRSQCMAAGMNLFLKKPVDMEAIRTALSTFLTLPAGEN